MNMNEFSYSVLYYMHDPIAKERVNIGVLVCCPAQNFIDFLCDTRYDHLARLFVEFDPTQFRSNLAYLRRNVHHLEEGFKRKLQNPPMLSSQEMASVHIPVLNDAGEFLKTIWPDNGLSFQCSEPMFGITEDPKNELNSLFAIFVGKQRQPHPNRTPRKTDDDIWSEFSRLLPRDAKAAIKTTRIITPKIEVKFDYAFQNSQWHAFQPFSVDYVDSDRAMAKAARWFGVGHALAGSKELSKMYLLMGTPKSGGERKTYAKVKNLLNEMPIEKEFVEERELSSFASETVEFMREHGVLK